MEFVEIRTSTVAGEGVFARVGLDAGTVILAMDDSQVVTQDAEHCDYLPDGTMILMQRPESHINHACAPNVFVTSVDKRRYLLAMRRIEPGEELFFDYTINAVGGDVWTCQCHAPECRGEHLCDFFALPEARQLAYLPFLDPWFARIHQDRVGALLARHAGRASK